MAESLATHTTGVNSPVLDRKREHKCILSCSTGLSDWSRKQRKCDVIPEFLNRHKASYWPRTAIAIRFCFTKFTKLPPIEEKPDTLNQRDIHNPVTNSKKGNAPLQWQWTSLHRSASCESDIFSPNPKKGNAPLQWQMTTLHRSASCESDIFSPNPKKGNAPLQWQMTTLHRSASCESDIFSPTHIRTFPLPEITSKGVTTQEQLKNRGILTKEDFKTFTQYLDRNIPKYIQLTYLDTDANCIHIDVEEGTLENIQTFITDELKYPLDMFDILEQEGEAEFGMFAVKSDMLEYDYGTKLITPGTEIVIGATFTGTLGAIMVDENRDCHVLTARHIFCQLPGYHQQEVPCSVQVNGDIVNIGNFSRGGLQMECDNFAIDVAHVPLTLTNKQLIYPYFMNDDFQPVSISCHTGESSNLKGCEVQTYGAKTRQKIKGQILISGANQYEKGKKSLSDCLLVGNKTVAFSQKGDSGALLTDVLNGAKNVEYNAYGIISKVYKKPYKIKENGQIVSYEGATTCVRLNHCLNALQEEYKINLKFPKPRLDDMKNVDIASVSNTLLDNKTEVSEVSTKECLNTSSINKNIIKGEE